MKRKNISVKMSCLENMMKCFSDADEFEDFAASLGQTIDEIMFTNQIILRNLHDQEYINMMTMKQIFMIGLFFKNNIEVMRDIISLIEYEELTDDEVKDKYETED